jgi:hypothetical protein
MLHLPQLLTSWVTVPCQPPVSTVGCACRECDASTGAMWHNVLLCLEHMGLRPVADEVSDPTAQ